MSTDHLKYPLLLSQAFGWATVRFALGFAFGWILMDIFRSCA